MEERLRKRRSVPRSEPVPGSRFWSQVIGENVGALRGRLSQAELAERMREVGHEGWSRTTVSELENARRTLSVEELLGLALVLDRPIGDLVDPTGPTGRRREPVDYAIGRRPPMGALEARGWVRGAAVAYLEDDGTVGYRPAPEVEVVYSTGAVDRVSRVAGIPVTYVGPDESEDVGPETGP